MRSQIGWLSVLLVAGGSLCTSAASAKDFGPGDLRLCGADRCAAITDRTVLHSLGRFVYDEGRPPLARTPRVGAWVFQLRFRNGYVAGLIGSPRLDRFRSHGVICGRFRRGLWYRIPARLASEVRRIASDLEPLRLTATVPRSC